MRNAESAGNGGHCSFDFAAVSKMAVDSLVVHCRWIDWILWNLKETPPPPPPPPPPPTSDYANLLATLPADLRLLPGHRITSPFDIIHEFLIIGRFKLQFGFIGNDRRHFFYCNGRPKLNLIIKLATADLWGHLKHSQWIFPCVANFV